MRGMAGNTKNEVKKYKAQEKALDKKLAALAKSKRQQDARARAREGPRGQGEAARGQGREGSVLRPFVIHPRATPSTRRRPGERVGSHGVEGAPPSTRHRVRRRPSATARQGRVPQKGGASSRGLEAPASEPVWKSASTPSSRRSYGDNVASMAWGARNLISTQVGGQGRAGPAQAREEDRL